MKMIRFFSIVAMAAILGVGIVSCKDKKVTDVQLSKSTLRLDVGQTTSLTATVLPADADNKNVRWESSNPSVATVVGNGLVTAISVGKAVIVATTVDGSKTAECNVTVEISTLAEITFPAGTLVIDLGDISAALEGVIAKSSNGNDITDSLLIIGLAYVGNGTLTYYMNSFDLWSGGNIKTRPVTIKPDKLFGNYSATETDLSDGTESTYNVTVTASSDITKLEITNFFNGGVTAVFEGNGKSTLLNMVPFTAKIAQWTANFTGTLQYMINMANTYAIYRCDFKIEWSDGEVSNYVVIFERQ